MARAINLAVPRGKVTVSVAVELARVLVRVTFAVISAPVSVVRNTVTGVVGLIRTSGEA